MKTRRFTIAFALLLMAFPVAGLCEPARPWRGKINGYDAYIPDLNKPVRAAMINNGVPFLLDDDPDWRAAAIKFNCIQFDISLDYRQPDDGAEKILATLNAASRILRDHREIQYTSVVLFGFSIGSAAVTITASNPRLSNPDPAKAPQRVAAVIGLDELDPAPYLPPLTTPYLFLSDPGDKFSGLLTDVEDAEPAITHDAFARNRATAEGAPLTLISQAGHWHGGSDYGMNNKIDYKFARIWLEEVLKLRLPPQPPTEAPAVMPDWRNYSGWLGTYDVVSDAGAPPWGNGERMTNIVIAPRADYRDPRPYIWLPSQYSAEVWRTYASTGTMPPIPPEKPITPVNAFVRTLGGKLSGSKDQPMRVDAGARHAPASGSAPCRLANDLTLIVTFDRAVASGKAAIGAGAATIAGPPTFWSNTMAVKLTDIADADKLRIDLTDIKSEDGGSETDATVSCDRR
jgi:hypothetical protein